MNETLQRLWIALRASSAGTKLVFVLSAATLVVVALVPGALSGRLGETPVFFGLDDYEVAAVARALGDAGIPFDVSGSTSPFTVSVQADDRSSAFAAAYGAGTLEKPLRGISTGGGIASFFKSPEERRQGMRRQDEQEMELMLETLDFVLSAGVRTTPGDGRAPRTASVALRTLGTLTASQEDTVARMVGKGLGIPREEIVVADHAGNTLFDGSLADERGSAHASVRASEAEHDARLAARVNGTLDATYGNGRARVVVTSEWDYEVSSVRSETSGKGSLIEETSSSSERPLAEAGDADGKGAEKTNESSLKYAPTLTTEERTSDVPTLRRLSVALFVDESIAGETLAEIEDNVRAAVGFDPQRDAFSRALFPTPPVDLAPSTPRVETPTARNPVVEALLDRGVEIAAGLVFVFLLLRSLGSSRKELAPVRATRDDEVDAELLARARVDELLVSDPDRVGEVLASWARGEETARTLS